MGINMDVSPAEQELILELRAKEETVKRQFEFLVSAIRLANEWVSYSIETADGLTFSTFIDGFACEDRISENLQDSKKLIFDAVKKIISVADRYADSSVMTIEGMK